MNVRDADWVNDWVDEPIEAERVLQVGDRTYTLRLLEDDPRHTELLVNNVPLVTCWNQTNFDRLIPSLRAEGYIA